jgi:hypothetical protein
VMSSASDSFYPTRSTQPDGNDISLENSDPLPTPRTYDGRSSKQETSSYTLSVLSLRREFDFGPEHSL